jgi:hypothetical protein
MLTVSPQETDTDIELERIKMTNQDILLGIESQIRKLMKAGNVKESIDLVVLAFQKKYIDEGKCHALLHETGHLAYAYYKDDLEFLASFIDKRCATAYMHGVEAEIFSQNIAFVPIIYQLCELAIKRDPTMNCYHGVGHAALGSNSINASYKVSLALKQCDKLANGPQNSLPNCYGGVFSEYGNLADNYDTDTGRRYSGPSIVTVSYEHPLEFCLTFDRKYQDDCARQLVKITYMDNPTTSFQECVYQGYPSTIQFICIRGAAKRYAAREMFIKGGESLKVPSVVFSYAAMLHRAFIDGVIEAKDIFADTGIPQDLATFCSSFPNQSDQNYCSSVDQK